MVGEFSWARPGSWLSVRPRLHLGHRRDLPPSVNLDWHSFAGSNRLVHDFTVTSPREANGRDLAPKSCALDFQRLS